jgi:deoxyribose-phosphate aldolase
MLTAGADRIGTSAGVAIVEEMRENDRGIRQ